MTLTLPAGLPAWIAYQDGEGAWKNLSGSNGSYTFKVTDASGRYGVAYGFIGAEGECSTQILQSTRAEGVAVVRTDDAASSAPVQVQGTLTGQPEGHATLAFLKDSEAWSSGTPLSYSLTTTKGSNDLFLNCWDSSQMPARYCIRRNLAIQGDTDLGNTDLVSAGVLPAQISMSVNGLNGEAALYQLSILTPNATRAFLHGGNTTTGGMTGYVLPSGSRANGDFYSLFAVSYASEGMRYASKYSDLSEATLSLDLPPAFTGAQVSLLAGSPRVRGQWAAVPGAFSYYFWAEQQTAGGSADCQMVFTPGWLGMASALQYTQPDFSAISGFDARWSFSTADALDWGLSYYKMNENMVYGNPMPAPRAGQCIQGSFQTGTLGNLPSPARRLSVAAHGRKGKVLRGFPGMLPDLLRF